MTEQNSDSKQPEKPGKRRVTMRDIAQKVGVSHVAVSKALRGTGSISAKTRKRILETAKEMGYVADPLLSVLTRYRHTSTSRPIQAELAWINPWKNSEQLRQYNEFNLYWEGAKANAQQLGYRLQEFNTAELSLKRLYTILKARHIQGILLPPLRESTGSWTTFPWDEFATVRFGLSISYPETHLVTSAQTANTILAYNEIRRLNYQRIGFVGEFAHLRLFGAGFYWAQRSCPPSRQLPILAFDAMDTHDAQQSKLNAWIKANKPDAILTDLAEIPLMLEKLHYRIPDDIGLATTSIHDTLIDAGIDQKPFEIGRVAVRTLTSLLTENSFGLPETRNEIHIEGKWVNGSMLPRREPSAITS